MTTFITHMGLRAVGRVGAHATILIAAVALAAACSGASRSPGVATLGSTTPTSAAKAPASTSSGSAESDALAYSRCMGAHGLADFPDPNTQGGISVSAGPGSDLDPNNAQYQAAQKACQSMLPKPTAAQQTQMHAAELAYAKCMRAHGIHDFPDPPATPPTGPQTDHSPAGGSGQRASIFGIPIQVGGDLDPSSPAFRAADRACGGNLDAGAQTRTAGAGGTP